VSDARASIPSYTARDGRLLVVRDGSLLPCRCPLCDKPAFGEVVTLRFSRRRRGRAGAGLFKFLIGLAIDRLSDYLNRDHYTGPVAVRMRLCRMHAARRRGMFVAGCVLLVGGSAGFLLTIYDRIGPWVGLPCLVGALIGFPVTVGGRPGVPRRLSGTEPGRRPLGSGRPLWPRWWRRHAIAKPDVPVMTAAHQPRPAGNGICYFLETEANSMIRGFQVSIAACPVVSLLAVGFVAAALACSNTILAAAALDEPAADGVANGKPNIEPDNAAAVERLAAGRAAFRQGEFTKALELLERELAARRERLGGRHPDVAQVLQNLAVVELDHGRFADAQTHASEALEIREAALGKDHPDVATTLNTLGAIEHARGDFTAAERHLSRAVEIRRTALGKDHPAVAESLGNLGCLLTTIGRFPEAEERLREAVAIRERQPDGDRRGLAAAWNNLAAVQLELLDPAAADSVAKAVRAATAFGGDHPAMIVILGNEGRSRARLEDANLVFDRAITLANRLGVAETPAYALLLNKVINYHIAMQDYPPIATLADRAVGICREVFGERHPATAMALNNLGVVQAMVGNGKLAAKLIRESLAINEAVLGKDHPAVAENLANLAAIEMEIGDKTAAERLWKRALETCERLGGEDSPQMVPIATTLGRWAAARRDPDAAERLYRTALAIASKRLGAEHPYTAVALTSLGILYWQLDRPREAEPLLEQALAIIDAVYGQDHPFAAVALVNLAAVQAEQQKLREARDTCIRALKVHDTVYGRLNRLSIDCRLRLADIFQGLGDPDAAGQLRAEAEADLGRLEAEMQPVRERPPHTTGLAAGAAEAA
jgi:tetratricopeptide (TPR) repeat protein